MTSSDVVYEVFEELGRLPTWRGGGTEYAFCERNHKLYTVHFDGTRKGLTLYQRNVSDLESAVSLTA